MSAAGRDAEAEERRAIRERDDAARGARRRRSGRAKSILASLGDGVVLFTPDGRVAHANPAVKELLGRRFETITELVPYDPSRRPSWRR